MKLGIQFVIKVCSWEVSEKPKLEYPNQWFHNQKGPKHSSEKNLTNLTHDDGNSSNQMLFLWRKLLQTRYLPRYTKQQWETSHQPKCL